MPYDVVHERCDYDFLINFWVKYQIFAIFSGGSSTNHTDFSDPWFYYTFEYAMALAGHIGTGALKDI